MEIRKELGYIFFQDMGDCGFGCLYAIMFWLTIGIPIIVLIILGIQYIIS